MKGFKHTTEEKYQLGYIRGYKQYQPLYEVTNVRAYDLGMRHGEAKRKENDLKALLLKRKIMEPKPPNKREVRHTLKQHNIEVTNDY